MYPFLGGLSDAHTPCSLPRTRTYLLCMYTLSRFGYIYCKIGCKFTFAILPKSYFYANQTFLSKYFATNSAFRPFIQIMSVSPFHDVQGGVALQKTALSKSLCLDNCLICIYIYCDHRENLNNQTFLTIMTIMKKLSHRLLSHTLNYLDHTLDQKLPPWPMEGLESGI